MTQESFAELVNVSSNHVSMLERGERKIAWNNVMDYAKVLNVNPSYIMCESDIIKSGITQITTDIDEFGVQDLLFIKLIESMGHNVLFHVIKVYEKRAPIERDFHGKKYKDWSSLEEKVSIDRLKDICFSDAHCMLIENDAMSEVLIVKVTIDGTTISYGEFTFLANRIFDYLTFHFHNGKYERICKRPRIPTCNE